MVGSDYAKIENLLKVARREVFELDSAVRDLMAERDRMLKSMSWRITLPLREGLRWIKAPKQQCWRYLEIIVNSKALPLSQETRRNLYAKFSKLFGLDTSFSAEKALERLKIETLVSSAHYEKIKHLDLAGQINSLRLNVTADAFLGKISSDPIVSVIIPIYGQLNYTLCLLASILSNLPETPFEIIIVDDFSPDESFEVLSQIHEINVFKNKVNMGFILSCNAAAKVAKGQYLLFLNNDTEVTPGWLDMLVKTFRDLPGTGLVGSRLIYPNGVLQEAGGIIWRDGSAWNFGRGQSPLLPAFNYAREVDYCSGASILIPVSIFVELGGFDEQYLPAYCEDADLALQIREKGYRVIYQPLSTVIHYEGITSGKDVSAGVKSYQIVNMKKLYEKWYEHLHSHQPNGVDIDNAKDRRATRRVLVVDHNTPTPDRDAGSLVVFNLMIMLREMGFQVTFFPKVGLVFVPGATELAQAVGIEMLYAPYCTHLDQHLKEFGARYDVVFLIRPEVVDQHIDAVRLFAPQAKVIYHTIDLHYLRMMREAEIKSDQSIFTNALRMRELELSSVRRSDCTIVVSEPEREALRNEGINSYIEVLPLILESKDSECEIHSRADLIFIGGFGHSPNIDAVKYFVSDIMPLIREKLKGIKLYIVGSDPPPEVQTLASNDVIVVGYVKDLSELLSSIKVSVAPLRFGAGVKGKVATSLAHGVPVVATSIAVEGMNLHDKVHVLVADGASTFSNAIIDLYEDQGLWDKLSKNGKSLINKESGPDAANKILMGIFQNLNIGYEDRKYEIKLYS